MQDNNGDYELLSENGSLQAETYYPQRVRLRWIHLFERNTIFLVLFLGISIITNVIMFTQLFQYRKGQSSSYSAQGDLVTVSRYSHLPREFEVPYPWSDGFSHGSGNDSYLDGVWEAININSGVLAIPDHWATEHNLPPTQRFPWDQTKGIYTLTAFHTLHCLKYIHRFVYDAHHGLVPSRNYNHVNHCLDSIRQDTMCNADDYPVSTPPGKFGNYGPHGQARQCRDWNKFLNWTKQFNSCYDHITDDREEFDELERFKFCPPGSPYSQSVENHSKDEDQREG